MKEQHNHNVKIEAGCCCGHHHSASEHRTACCGNYEVTSEQGKVFTDSNNENCDCKDDSGGDEEDSDHHHIEYTDQDHCSCNGEDGCNYMHDHGKVDNNSLMFIAISVAIFLVSLLFPWVVVKFLLCAVSVLVSGWKMFKIGIKNILKFSFEEKALLTIAVLAAFLIGEYSEAAIVTILFKLGGYFEAKAITKSRGEIESLTKIRPDSANVIFETGKIEKYDAISLPIGTKILIKSGEKIPLDCVVLEGETFVDNSALTGESVAVSIGVGSKLMSGAVNTGGIIICKTTSLFENSAASRIIRLVEEAASQKGETETFITKFARIYTPIVIVLAIMLAFIPPLFSQQDIQVWVDRALVFLVTSCPCAFVISVPLSFYSGIGACSKNGILVKGSKYIEKLAKADCVVMDKTGTVTSGKLRVSSIDLYTERDIGDLIAIAESFSNHPTAAAISDFFKQRQIDTTLASEINEIAGMGIDLKIDGVQYYSGSYRLMEQKGISILGAEGANVYFANEKELLAAVKMADTPREEAAEAIVKLRDEGIQNVTILTGDGAGAAEYVKNEIGADKVESNLLPKDKVDLMSEIKQKHESTIYIGDGINDAPVIAISDCGIAMGMGSEAAINTADAVLVEDNLFGISKAIKISKKTMSIAKANIIMAMGVKGVILILGALGLVAMWAAIIADVGIMIVAVLNSTRVLVSAKKEENIIAPSKPVELIPELD